MGTRHLSSRTSGTLYALLSIPLSPLAFPHSSPYPPRYQNIEPDDDANASRQMTRRDQRPCRCSVLSVRHPISSTPSVANTLTRLQTNRSDTTPVLFPSAGLSSGPSTKYPVRREGGPNCPKAREGSQASSTAGFAGFSTERLVRSVVACALLVSPPFSLVWEWDWSDHGVWTTIRTSSIQPVDQESTRVHTWPYFEGFRNSSSTTTRISVRAVPAICPGVRARLFLIMPDTLGLNQLSLRNAESTLVLEIPCVSSPSQQAKGRSQGKESVDSSKGMFAGSEESRVADLDGEITAMTNSGGVRG